MKCKNCPRTTKSPTSSTNWRNDQLCPICAYKLFPKKYTAPNKNTMHLLDLPSEKFGRYAKTRGDFNSYK